MEKVLRLSLAGLRTRGDAALMDSRRVLEGMHTTNADACALVDRYRGVGVSAAIAVWPRRRIR